MLPYTDKKPGWKSGRHDPTCACHHIQVDYFGGAQFQHFSKKRKKQEESEGEMNGGRARERER